MPEKPSMLMPALYGGIIMGVLSGIPYLSFINCLCCAGVLLGGFMAVFFYNKDLTPDMPPLTSGDSIKLGALAGLFGAIVGNVIAGLVMVTIGNVAGEAMYEMLISIYDSVGILDQMPSEAIDEMEQGMTAAELDPTTIIISFVVNPLFGLLGGLIGYQVYKPKDKDKGATPAEPSV
ncbi:MAG: hypothetical protein KAJ12_11665 [Bacteroidetes bacterium]|nr:hypothetical protein [Bacteroidota bacterium]